MRDSRVIKEKGKQCHEKKIKRLFSKNKCVIASNFIHFHQSDQWPAEQDSLPVGYSL